MDRVIGLSTRPPAARLPSSVLDNQVLASTSVLQNQVRIDITSNQYCLQSPASGQVLPGQNSSVAVPVVASNSLDTAIDYDNDSEDYVIIDNPLGSGGECRRDIQ